MVDKIKHIFSGIIGVDLINVLSFMITLAVLIL